MKDIIKKSFLLGLGAASLTKSHAEKIVKDLVKRNEVTIKEGRDMLNKVKKAALNNSGIIRNLAEKEAKRVAGKLGVKSQVQIAKVKGKLMSIDKELSAKGKTALKKILKELSK